MLAKTLSKTKFSLLLVIAGICAAYAVMSLRGQHFDRSPEEVRDAILSATAQTGWLGSTNTLRVAEADSGTIITRFVNAEGRASLTINSEISDNWGSTQVTSTFTMNKSALSREDAEALRVAGDGAIGRYVKEHIASHAEDRRFDLLALSAGGKALGVIAQWADDDKDTKENALKPALDPVSLNDASEGFTSDAELERGRRLNGANYSDHGGFGGSGSGGWGD